MAFLNVNTYIRHTCLHRRADTRVLVTVSVSCFAHCWSCDALPPLMRSLSITLAHPLNEVYPIANVLKLSCVKHGDPVSVYLLMTWHAVASPSALGHLPRLFRPVTFRRRADMRASDKCRRCGKTIATKAFTDAVPVHRARLPPQAHRQRSLVDARRRQAMAPLGGREAPTVLPYRGPVC